MAMQREKEKVVIPFSNYMRSQGWHCENLHGNAFQQGLPDQMCVRNGRIIFIEYKVLENSCKVSYTDAQKAKFPILMGHGVKIYIIAARDLTKADPQTVREIKTLYNTVIAKDECNGFKLFIPDLHSTLNPYQQHKIDHLGRKK